MKSLLASEGHFYVYFTHTGLIHLYFSLYCASFSSSSIWLNHKSYRQILAHAMTLSTWSNNEKPYMWALWLHKLLQVWEMYVVIGNMYYLPQGGYVIGSMCLFATQNSKKSWRDFDDFFSGTD